MGRLVSLKARLLQCWLHRILGGCSALFQGWLVFLHTGCQGGYWTEQLDEQSQLLTGFNTPLKKYCFVSLPFGLSTCIDNVRVPESIEEHHDIHLYWRLQRKLVKRESSWTHKSILSRNRKLSTLDVLSLRKESNSVQRRCKESKCSLRHPTSKTCQAHLRHWILCLRLSPIWPRKRF